MADDNKRTDRQNRALHLYFTMLTEALNDAGYDMRRTLKQDIDISWTPDNIKNYLWRPIQEAKLNKTSTTELNTKDIDSVYDELNRHLGEKLGVHVPFPSIEDLMKGTR